MATLRRDRGPVRRRLAGPALVAVLAVVVAGAAACGGGDGGGGTPSAGGAELSADARRGEAVVRQNGCSACHSTDGSTGPGPTFRGLYGSQVELQDGGTATADDAYLTRAIRDPQAQVAAGYAIQMPANSLDADDVAAVVAYLQALGR